MITNLSSLLQIEYSCSMEFFDLPTTLLDNLIGKWLTTFDLMRLHGVCLKSHKSQQVFLNTVQAPHFTTPGSRVQEIDDSQLLWHMRYKIKLKSVVLSDPDVNFDLQETADVFSQLENLDIYYRNRLNRIMSTSSSSLKALTLGGCEVTMGNGLRALFTCTQLRHLEIREPTKFMGGRKLELHGLYDSISSILQDGKKKSIGRGYADISDFKADSAIAPGLLHLESFICHWDKLSRKHLHALLEKCGCWKDEGHNDDNANSSCCTSSSSSSSIISISSSDRSMNLTPTRTSTSIDGDDNALPRATHPRSRRLQRIELHRMKNVNESTLQLIASRCPQLKCLRLVGCTSIAAAGLASLVATPSCCFHQLEILDLNGSAQCVNELVIAQILGNNPKLREINLRHCSYGVSSATVMKIAVHCPQLRALDISYCHRVKDDGMLLLANKCRQLQDLQICGCECITDAAMVRLANLCTKLTSINIKDCPHITKFSCDAFEFMGVKPYRKKLS